MPAGMLPGNADFLTSSDYSLHHALTSEPPPPLLHFSSRVLLWLPPPHREEIIKSDLVPVRGDRLIIPLAVAALVTQSLAYQYSPSRQSHRKDCCLQANSLYSHHAP